LRLDELAASLAVFAASPRFAGLVVTEINPDHAPDPGVLRRFLAAVTKAVMSA
jgi:arginase